LRGTRRKEKRRKKGGGYSKDILKSNNRLIVREYKSAVFAVEFREIDDAEAVCCTVELGCVREGERLESWVADGDLLVRSSAGFLSGIGIG
jgi:hypothetical protein